MATANIKAVVTAEDKASGVLGAFGDNVRGMANKAAVALGATGAALTVMAKQATDFTKEYVSGARAMARETGNTIEESSRLLYVTRRLGITADEASAQFGMFSRRIKDGAEAFTTMGVQTKNADGNFRSFNEILLDVADRFRAMPDGLEKTALSMELFGRSGKEMIKVLNLGSQGIAELQTQADKLGLTLTPNTVEKIAAYIRSQKDLKDSTDAMKIAIGTATAPILTAFNQKLIEVMNSAIGSDGAIRTMTIGVIAFGGPVLTATAAVIAFAANIAQVAQALGAARLAALAAAGPVALIGAALVAAGFGIANAWNQATDAINAAKRAIASMNVAEASAVRTLQQKAAEARARGDQATANKLAHQIKLILAPAMQHGGPVTGGRPYVVGEAGPELFVPKQSGQVVPNTALRKGGGSQNISLNVNVGVYAGSEMEKRKLALDLWRSLGDLAGSRSKTPQQLLGM